MSREKKAPFTVRFNAREIALLEKAARAHCYPVLVEAQRVKWEIRRLIWMAAREVALAIARQGSVPEGFFRGWTVDVRARTQYEHEALAGLYADPEPPKIILPVSMWEGFTRN